MPQVVPSGEESPAATSRAAPAAPAAPVVPAQRPQDLQQGSGTALTGQGGDWVLPLAGAGAAGLLGLAALAGGELSGEGHAYLMLDPAKLLGGPWYTGAVSVLGALLWWTAAVASGLACLIDRAMRRVHVLALGFSVLVTLDDLLQLHEEVFEDQGLPEEVVLFTYLLLFAAWWRRARPTASWQDRLLALLVVGLLGASVAFDLLLQPIVGQDVPLLEDGAKLVGAGVWAGLHLRSVVARVALRPS